MLSPKDEMQRILDRLREIETVINPTNAPFYFPLEHELCAERDQLITAYYELRRYGDWFFKRHPSILIGMHLTGATSLQARINHAVAWNTH